MIESAFFAVASLENADLFLSFARLRARRAGHYNDPSETRIKKWVKLYGSPAKDLSERESHLQETLGPAYIDLHHLYITQRTMLRNGVQAGEENSA
jgi:hypothetical protein